MFGSIDLVVIRHAESQWNADARFQGHQGTGLSVLGHRQATQLATALIEEFPDVHAVVASDLQRVRETAAPYLAETGRKASYDPGLREIDVGDWGGLLHAEVEREFPDQVAAVQRGEDVARGGGETWSALRARIWGAVTSLAVRSVAQQDGRAACSPVLVFTHAGPIRVAAAAALDLGPMGHRWLVEPRNCSVARLRLHVSEGTCTSAELLEYDLQLTTTTRERVSADGIA